ncbi:MAG: hypothetical protein WAM52_18155 [Steroidobacteraceae bacterium]
MQESPHFKRSALWQHQLQITAWLQEGYSFRQIATELTRQGTKVSTRWLQEWYAKNVGRRRARAQAPHDTNASRQAGGNPSPPRAAGPSSPAPGASAAPVPEPDVTALFQSQFKRPRK